VKLAPESAVDAAAIASDESVAPTTFTPFFFHWYRSPDPSVATVNITGCPATAVWSAGCVVIAGPAEAAVTVKAAGALATLPESFVTTTRNSAPLSAVAVCQLAVAPAISTPFRSH